MGKNSKVRTMELIGEDFWGCPVYRCVETGEMWKDITLGDENPDLYSCQNDFYGEPDSPIKKELEIRFISKYEKNKYENEYSMLGRLESDCKYYLGYGNRNKGCLYYKDEKEHITQMKALYNSIPDDKKPEWITWEQILKYEKEMVK